MVRKRGGELELYQRAKLIASVRTACAKRPVSPEDIESLVDGVEEELSAGDNSEADSLRIGALVMDGLRAADQVAYVRFASVYRNFQDTTEFMEEVRQLVMRAGRRLPGQAELFAPEDQ